MEVAKDHFWFDWTQYTARRQIAGFIWFHHLRETWKKQRGDSSSDTSMPDVKRASWRKFQSRRNYFSALKKTHLFLLLIYIWVIIYIYIHKYTDGLCGRVVPPKNPRSRFFRAKKSESKKTSNVASWSRCLQDMELAYHWAAWKVGGEGLQMVSPDPRHRHF